VLLIAVLLADKRGGQAGLRSSHAAALVEDRTASLMRDVCKTWNPSQLIQTLRLTLTHAAIAMLSSASKLPPTPAIWPANSPQSPEKCDVICIQRHVSTSQVQGEAHGSFLVKTHLHLHVSCEEISTEKRPIWSRLTRPSKL
jgi:hypothetical protein